jgi:glutamate N-acetyltransferase / amino-acid N-acetyltransferase
MWQTVCVIFVLKAGFNLIILMNSKIQVLFDGSVTSPLGFLAGAVYAGIKPKIHEALDLSLLYSEVTCRVAAVFTTNKVKAAPIILDRDKLEKGMGVRAVLINSGCANACTGTEGMQNAVISAELAAEFLGISADEVMVSSTGVIGMQLPVEKISEAIPQIALSRDGGHKLAKAIMTTDTRPKEYAVEVTGEDYCFIIGGAAKGSGMIHPNMATMLAYITTDAAVEGDFLKKALREVADATFNMVIVDGDTSTNDTLMILSSGKAGNRVINAESDLAEDFKSALYQVCLGLAKSIAADGEGATRLIEVVVTGALSESDARKAAITIAGSPLVKTAVHGNDPNWGRIIAAAGRSGIEMDTEKTDVYIGPMCLLKSGQPMPFERTIASSLLDQPEVMLKVDLNMGEGSASAWGCDLSAEYVAINAEYTT